MGGAGLGWVGGVDLGEVGGQGRCGISGWGRGMKLVGGMGHKQVCMDLSGFSVVCVWMSLGYCVHHSHSHSTGVVL